ncbi:MAG TPA: hypothetical protein VFX49_07195 [Chloroflexota bacterium]|nr:hypothetical protein [Chloroflexota bacterium]
MPTASGRYRIRVHGELGPEWSTWFDDLAVTARPDGDTMLEGVVRDQAALHGLLGRIRDLGLTLISVKSLDHHRKEGTETCRTQ